MNETENVNTVYGDTECNCVGECSCGDGFGFRYSTITLLRRQYLAQMTSMGPDGGLRPAELVDKGVNDGVAQGSLPANIVPTRRWITHIAFGVAGVNAAGVPITPSETQHTLNAEVARYPIDKVQMIPVGGSEFQLTNEYTVTIPANELASLFISEAALVDQLGGHHAIINFYRKGKDDGVSMRFFFRDAF